MATSNIERVSKLPKASITNLNTGVTIPCQFNPNELTIKKQNQWKDTPKAGTNMSDLEFSGGKPATTTLNLFFDTTSTGKDVRKEYTDKLLEMMLIDENKKNPTSNLAEPPRIRFQWGSTRLFEAVITDITQKFTMFLADGTPVRATATVNFKQSKDEGRFHAQNPTSRSDARKIHIVLEGESLDWIAYQEYGDASAWRHIAEANNLDDPKDLRPGQVLNLVPLL